MRGSSLIAGLVLLALGGGLARDGLRVLRGGADRLRSARARAAGDVPLLREDCRTASGEQLGPARRTRTRGPHGKRRGPRCVAATVDGAARAAVETVTIVRRGKPWFSA